MSKDKDNEQKFDPVREFIILRDNLTRAVGQGLRNVAGGVTTFPAVDVYETEEAVVIRTEPMIGVSTSTIEVGMEEEILVISGETKDNLDVLPEAYIQQELKFGAFSREIHIPRQVDSSKATASFKQNVLTITLPKTSKKSGQIIDVIPAE